MIVVGTEAPCGGNVQDRAFSPAVSPPFLAHIYSPMTFPLVLSLSSLSSYPDFLSTRSAQPGVLLGRQLQSIGPLRPLDRFTPEHRTALADAALAGLERWNAPARARSAARLLAAPNTWAVVTGQQAGIGTGPLYTVLKAVGTIRTAGELRRQNPEAQFVPVFWIEGDDHDFDEARTFAVLDRSGQPATLRYDDGDARPLHVGDRTVKAEAFAQLLDELRAVLPETEFAAATLDLLHTAYTAPLADGSAPTLSDGFARTLYALLGDQPIVLVSSRDAALKRLAADVMVQEICNPDLLFNAVQGGVDALRAEGIDAPIEPKPGALFMTHEGERRSIDIEEEGYSLRGTDLRFTREALAAQAADHPERFSPRVALRPLVQDAILPTAIYLGGPSEVAYQMQLRGAYQAFGLSAPAIAPRPFAAIVEPKVLRVLEQLALPLEQLMDPSFDPVAAFVDAEAVETLENEVARVESSIERAWNELAPTIEEIDTTLSKTLQAGIAASRKELEKLTGKLRSALKRRESTSIERAAAARTMLLPGGELQERTLAPISFTARYGVERLGRTLALLQIDPTRLQLLRLAD